MNEMTGCALQMTLVETTCVFPYASEEKDLLCIVRTLDYVYQCIGLVYRFASMLSDTRKWLLFKTPHRRRFESIRPTGNPYETTCRRN
jgi:hypothetical protein